MITQFLIAKPGAAATSTVAAPTPVLLESVRRQIQANIFVTKRMNGATGLYKVRFNDFTGRSVETPEFRDQMASTSAVVVYKNGVSFSGTAMHNFPTSLYRSLGIQSDSLISALDFISKNEGKYDAINSYDRAIFSYGFVQFAGGNRTLQSLFALIK
jgi:peptidoglycan endopeptidase LytF